MSLTYNSFLGSSSTQVLYVRAQPSASIGEAQAEDIDTTSKEGYKEGQFVLIKHEGETICGTNC